MKMHELVDADLLLSVIPLLGLIGMCAFVFWILFSVFKE